MADIQALLKKYEDELRTLGTPKLAEISMWGPGPIRNTPITAKENYRRVAFRKEKPLWLPSDMDEIMFTPKLYPDNIIRNFVFEHESITDEEAGGTDMFGAEWVYVPVAGGSTVRPGNPLVKDISEWEKYITFPDPSKWDWEGSSKRNADLMDDYYPMNTWIMTGLFERLISFLDFEAAAMALIDEEQQEDVHRLFNYLTELYIDIIDRFKKNFPLDVIYFHDDWGAQRAPFFSLDTCREMLVPYLKRITDAVHERGMIFNFHCCGCNERLLPAMIEAGVDIWCGQPMNNFERMYDEYGEQITLGIYCEPPTPEASLDEVVEYCEKFIDRYTRKGIAIPSVYGDAHPQFFDVMYCLSRERFL